MVGERHEERLAAGLDSKGIIEQTKTREIASTWRVYRKEPVFVGRFDSKELAEHAAVGMYAGRLLPEDVLIEDDDFSTDAILRVRIWNVESEWKDQARAREHADELVMQEIQIVERNSRAEHLLRQYGVLKLARS